ncbi:hypothetical protein E4U43_003292, partial [Claviceps pusilla]
MPVVLSTGSTDITVGDSRRLRCERPLHQVVSKTPLCRDSGTTKSVLWQQASRPIVEGAQIDVVEIV